VHQLEIKVLNVLTISVQKTKSMAFKGQDSVRTKIVIIIIIIITITTK